MKIFGHDPSLPSLQETPPSYQPGKNRKRSYSSDEISSQLYSSRSETSTSLSSEALLVKAVYDINGLFNANGHTDISSIKNFLNSLEASAHTEPSHREFYINMVVWRHSLEQISADHLELKIKIATRILSYAYKFCTIDPKLNEFCATSPIQSQDWADDAYYHRCEFSRLNQGYIDFTSALSGISKHNLLTVTTDGIHPLIKKSLIEYQNPRVNEWKDGGKVGSPPELLQTQQVHFERAFPNTAAILHQARSPDSQHLYFDISDYLQPIISRLPRISELGSHIRTYINYIRDTIEYGVKSELEYAAQNQDRLNLVDPALNGEDQLGKIMGKVDRCVMVGATLYIGCQHIIFSSHLTNYESERSHLKPRKSKQELGPPTCVSKSSGVLTPKSKELMLEANSSGGFMPMPLLIMEKWVQISQELGPIFDRLGIRKKDVLQIPSTGFSPSSGIFIPDFKGVLIHPACKAFRALSSSSRESYTQILPRMTMKMLEGLQDLHVDDVFNAYKLNSLLQFCYARILVGMSNAVEVKSNFPKFINKINLIHEEIASLLAVVEPYKKSDIHSVMLEADQNRWVQHGVKPRFHFRNSGMSCMQSVLSACERKIYQRADPGAKATIGFSTDSYFENLKIADLWHMRQKDSADNPVFDIWVGHFHPSCNPATQTYHPEDMIASIENIFTAQQAAPHFVVMVDTTVGYFSKSRGVSHIDDFVSHFKNKIQEKKMSVIDVRSLQKTDQAGLDMYAGGSIAVYSCRDDFQGEFCDESDKLPLSTNNLQGILHFQKMAQVELDARREAVMHTTQRLLSPDDPLGFPASLYLSADNKNPIQITPNSDPNCPFIDFQLMIESAQDGGDLLASHLAQKCALDPDHFSFTQRDSFGFNQSSGADIDNHLRLSPGLEPEKYFLNFRDYIVHLNDLLLMCSEKFPGHAELIITQLLEDEKSTIELVDKMRSSPGYENSPQGRFYIHQMLFEIVSRTPPQGD
jgi:hypothetical protein